MTTLSPTPTPTPTPGPTPGPPGTDVVVLHPLEFLVEDDGVVVGRRDVDSYGVFPPDGAELIKQLAAGLPVAGAADWYLHRYGEPVDLPEFLDTLAELDFMITEPTPSSRPTATAAAGRLRGQRLGAVLFSRPALAAAVVVVLGGLLLMITDHRLLPHPRQVFFTDYLLPVELVLAFGQLPLILVHECCHLLAARRRGVRARIGVSHRFYFVVFETTMDGLVLLPRRQRYLPILAGMLADLVLAALLTGAAELLLAGSPRSGRPSLAAGVCLALAFTTLVRTALELLLFLRTDLYYLAATASGCTDLHGTTRELVRAQAGRLWRRLLGRPAGPVDPTRWSSRDRRAARWYAPLYLGGYLVAGAMLIMVLAPVSWTFLTLLVGALVHPDLGSAHFWDAALSFVLTAAQPIAAGLLALRERHRARLQRRASDRRRSRPPTRTVPDTREAQS